MKKRIISICLLTVMLASVFFSLTACVDDEEIYYTVSFDLNEGVGTIQSQEVKEGDLAQKPADPTREGYEFSGWYLENKKWSFTADFVTADLTLRAAWEKNGVSCAHEDSNEDYVCDLCDQALKKEENADIEKVASIVFQMNRNTRTSQFSFYGDRYLAGEDKSYSAQIDSDIRDRNTAATTECGATVTYQYWPDTDIYSWGLAVDKITTSVYSSTKDSPDIYSCFVADMVAASFKGCFKNLLDTSSNSGENHFEFANPQYQESIANDPTLNKGYMYEYMKNLSFSKDKMYILASDYFIDAMRAAYVIPVNVALLEEVLPMVSNNGEDDKEYKIVDFYSEVYNKKWTYSRVAEYSAALHSISNGESNDQLGRILGFAVSTSSVATSGMFYSSSVRLAQKKTNNLNEFTFDYEDQNEELVNIFVAIKSLVNSDGVFVVTARNCKDYGTTNVEAIRNRFCENKILFGDIVLLGSLEESPYQTLKATTGFGVAPVPLSSETSEGSAINYNTAIHTTARLGAIAKGTAEFSKCTAFLNYQSTHSKGVLNAYFSQTVQADTTKGSDATVQMLEFIRLNVCSSFDSTVEDVIKILGYSLNVNTLSIPNILQSQNFVYGDSIRAAYQSFARERKVQLFAISAEYEGKY